VSDSLDKDIAGWSLAEIETYLRDRQESGAAASAGVQTGAGPSGGAPSAA